MLLRVNNRNSFTRLVSIFLVAILVACLIASNNLTTTAAYYTDIETASTNSIQAWNASLWTQTSEVNFNAGVLNNVNTALYPGDVILDKVLSEPTTSIGAEQTWYYASWSRRIPVTVTNTGSAQTNYQVRIDVTYDSDMQPDFDDIRFVDTGDATPLSFWRESYVTSTSAIFWVNIPSIPAGSKTIYMYYGNGTASYAGDGDATFIFFDDFPGSTIDGTKWNAWNATASVSGSVVTIDNTGAWGGIFSQTGYTLPYRFTCRVQKTTILGLGQAGLERWYATTGDDTIHALDVWGGGRQEIYYTSKYDDSDEWDEIGTWNLSTWYHIEIRGETDRVRYYRDGGLRNDEINTTAIPAGTMEILFSSATTGDQLLVDYCFISQYVDPEPTTSLGAEDGWSRWAPVTISNPVAAQTDYQVRVDVTYDADMQPDFDDIRFFDSDGITSLSFWRESYTASTSAIFWVKVPSVPSGSKFIYMYYGDNTASTASDGNATFEFFDDFSGDLSKWTIDPENTDMVYIDSLQGNSAPALRHDPDSSQTKNGYFDTRLMTSSYTILNGVIEYDVFLAGAPRIIHQLGFRVNSLAFTNGYCWRMQNSATDGGWLRFSNGSWSNIGTNWGPTTGGVWHSVKLEVKDTNFTAYIDGGSAIPVTDTNKQTVDYLVSHVHGVSLTASSYVLIDNIRVRKYALQSVYASPGTLASQVLDTGAAGTTWDCLFWDETLQSSTDITFEVRASDILFNAADATPSWTSVGGTSPVITGLPAGRYKQWRAVLTTSDTANTPTIHEARLYYY